MANAILFIGWNRPLTADGRDAFNFLTTEGMAFLKSQEGKAFERLEMFGLTAHGGDLNGGIILFGTRPKLDELRRTDEFEAFAMKLGGLFSNFGVIPGVNWEGIQQVMTRWNKKP